MAMEFYYFNLPFWRGDLPRLLFHLGGLEVKDHKVTQEQMEKLKSDGVVPFGQVPVLKVGDQTITQASGILKFVGKKAGYYPTDDLLAAKVDEAIFMFEEMSVAFIQLLKTSPEQQEKAVRDFVDKSPLMGNVNALIGDKDYVVGDSMTVADLLCWSLFPFLENHPIAKHFKKGDFDKYENIQRVIANVAKEERIAEYEVSRKA